MKTLTKNATAIAISLTLSLASHAQQQHAQPNKETSVIVVTSNAPKEDAIIGIRQAIARLGFIVSFADYYGISTEPKAVDGSYSLYVNVLFQGNQIHISGAGTAEVTVGKSKGTANAPITYRDSKQGRKRWAHLSLIAQSVPDPISVHYLSWEDDLLTATQDTKPDWDRDTLFKRKDKE